MGANGEIECGPEWQPCGIFLEVESRKRVSQTGHTVTRSRVVAQRPVVFTTHLRPQPWGGRRLERILGRSLPSVDRFGESWELSGHPFFISEVADGPLAGTTLEDIWERHRSDWMPGRASSPFPWLLKFLDCHEFVSVQVHPSDELARRFCPQELGKSEAWVVLDVDPGARIYAGLRPGVDRQAVEAHLRTGTLVECLHSFEPIVGDCVYLPAGTVHSLGGGVLVAEVQQTSDATLRLYDWNRPGLDGRPRPLQVAEALESIDWSLGPVVPLPPVVLPVPAPAVSLAELLVECDYFRWERYSVDAGNWPVPSDQLAAWTVIDGAAHLSHNGQRRSFARGDTVLIPPSDVACVWSFDAPAILLKVTLPPARR